MVYTQASSFSWDVNNYQGLCDTYELLNSDKKTRPSVNEQGKK